MGAAPNKNKNLQPMLSINSIPEIAAATPPKAKPVYINTYTKERYFAGEYSVVNADAAGTIPPIPSPAIKRKTPNTSGEFAKAIKTIMNDNSVRETIITIFLPNLSDSIPSIDDP